MKEKSMYAILSVIKNLFIYMQIRLVFGVVFYITKEHDIISLTITKYTSKFVSPNLWVEVEIKGIFCVCVCAFGCAYLNLIPIY